MISRRKITMHLLRINLCLLLTLSIAGGQALAAAEYTPYLQMPIDMYPPKALAAGLEGNLDITLTAGPDGRVERCLAKGDDALAPLKVATCDILTRRIAFRASSPPQTLNIVAEWKIPKVSGSDKASVEPSSFGGAIPISPRQWFFTDDFPSSEIGGRGGATSVTFKIGVNGRATACKVSAGSGSAALDAKTCEMIETRGRFIPALGNDNKPHAAQAHYRVTWQS